MMLCCGVSGFEQAALRISPLYLHTSNFHPTYLFWSTLRVVRRKRVWKHDAMAYAIRFSVPVFSVRESLLVDCFCCVLHGFGTWDSLGRASPKPFVL